MKLHYNPFKHLYDGRKIVVIVDDLSVSDAFEGKIPVYLLKESSVSSRTFADLDPALQALDACTWEDKKLYQLFYKDGNLLDEAYIVDIKNKEDGK